MAWATQGCPKPLGRVSQVVLGLWANNGLACLHGSLAQGQAGGNTISASTL